MVQLARHVRRSAVSECTRYWLVPSKWVPYPAPPGPVTRVGKPPTDRSLPRPVESARFALPVGSSRSHHARSPPCRPAWPTKGYSRALLPPLYRAAFSEAVSTRSHLPTAATEPASPWSSFLDMPMGKERLLLSSANDGGR